MHEVVRTVFWRRLDYPGAEYCHLRRRPDGWELSGTVLVALDGRPLRAHYQVVCDAGWATRAVSLETSTGGTPRTLRLTADEQRRWWSAGVELVPLRGCVDVDLGVSPSTNTLPIRRLGLEIGAAVNIGAAWVRFPELEVSRLDQRYSRLDTRRYRYQSLPDGHAYAIEVDDLGLVRRYEDGWECVAVNDARAMDEAGKEEPR
jgi:uncharacterized protein